MQSPINEIDFLRFMKLSKLIKENKTEDDTLKIYISNNFVSLEIVGHNIPRDKIQEILSLPIENLIK